jgi:8-oxo-dGTP diphosphatase
VALPVAAAFCPRCARRLGRDADGRPRCEGCGYVWYSDPKVAVGVLAERGGRLLLVRRNHEPRLGQWAFPSGYVDAGEVLEEAAAREVREETDVEVRIDALLGAWSTAGDPVVFIAYAATIVRGDPVPGPEASDVAMFDPDGLPPLAFDHDPEVVAAWRRWRERQAAR